MYGLTLQKIAEVVQGRLEGEGQENIQPRGAGIDTRTLNKGDLFFALEGERVDGHNYLQQAREKGAAAAVVKRMPAGFVKEDFPLVFAKDPNKALQQVAMAQREIFHGPVIGITGSTGKTTTKDMLWSILKEKGPVLKTWGNYNNELGLPLTLLSLKEEHWAVILEMGMRGLNEIDQLARISTPKYGVITNIGHTHQELLGTQEKIAQAKAELLSHLPYDGGVVLNDNDRKILKPWLSNIRCSCTWFGTKTDSDLWAQDIEEHKTEGLSFTIQSKTGARHLVKIPVHGKHNVANALAAIGVAQQMGLGWDMMEHGLFQLKLTPMRMELKHIKEKDLLIIDDAYNANPDSMVAALDVLQLMAGDKKRAVAILGDMYELGDYEEKGHLLIGKKASEIGLAQLITVGKLGAIIARGAEKHGMSKEKIRACQNNQEVLSFLKGILQAGDVVLIKGSRGVKMEEITKGLLL